MPDTEPEAPARACPACGAPADGHRVSHLKFARDTPGPRYSLLYAEPCGCQLDPDKYRVFLRSLRPPH